MPTSPNPLAEYPLDALIQEIENRTIASLIAMVSPDRDGKSDVCDTNIWRCGNRTTVLGLAHLSVYASMKALSVDMRTTEHDEEDSDE